MSRAGPRERDGGPNADRSRRSRLARSVVPGVVRRSYALKFTLALLAVVVLIAAIGGLSYVQIGAITEEDAGTTLRSTASIQADVVAEWDAGIQRQVHGLATSDVYRSGNPGVIGSHLRESQAVVRSDVESAHYVDPVEGVIVASTDPEFEGRAVAAVSPSLLEPVERAAAQSADDRSVATSERAYERDGKLLTAYAAPAQAGDGVVVLVSDVRWIFERLHGSETSSTTRVLHVDGTEVTAPRQARAMSLSSGSAFEEARTGTTSIHEHDGDVIAFAAVEGTNWIVVAEAPTSRLYEASETVGRNVVFLVLSSLAALTVVGVVLGRGTILPLIRLRERTRELEAGNFDVDLRTDREDEIGRLFVSFARMRDALAEQISETEAARERAERSRREIERQNERLDQFASTVSHDLRNPLNVAEGYREVLRAELEDGEDLDAAELEGYVSMIGESHERMGAIVEDVLALAREGRRIDDVEPIDLATLATDAWSTVDHGEATLSVADTTTIEGDRDRLRRAFENLFRNAVEHAGSSVAVEVGPTETGFYVADDGPGIPADAVEDVFEYGHTTSCDGTGFGLAIVEAIVTAHDWTIAVDEAYETGATFVVSGVDR